MSEDAVALRAEVQALAAAALVRFADGPARERVERVVQRLGEPTLRIAVGGRLNAGKSTLVNALLGVALAPTDATECTRVVTWFRPADRDGVLVHPTEGPAYELPAPPGGGVPADLGRAHTAIASVEVRSRAAALAGRHGIVDTPGLDSPTGLDAASVEALRQADALIYVMPLPGKGDEEALSGFRAALAESGLSVVNTVGVLSRIDELGTGRGDPWPQARRIAQGYATRLNGLLCDVLPIVGALAAAGAEGALSEADAADIRALAASVPPASRAFLLSSWDDLAAWPNCPLPAQRRRRLWRLLGGHGLRTAVELADTGAARNRGALAAALHQRSGVDALLTVVQNRFLAGADALRAAAAVAELDRLVWSPVPPRDLAAVSGLRAGLAALRRRPELRRADLGARLSLHLAQGGELSPEMGDDLLPLLEVGTAAGTGRLGERVARLRRHEVHGRLAEARLARRARELCECLLYEQPLRRNN